MSRHACDGEGVVRVRRYFTLRKSGKKDEVSGRGGEGAHEQGAVRERWPARKDEEAHEKGGRGNEVAGTNKKGRKEGGRRERGRKTV